MRHELSPKIQELADILMNFLKFNPFYRMTSYECLTKCKIFDSVRDLKKEKYLKSLHLLKPDENNVRKSSNLKFAFKSSKPKTSE